MIKNNQTKKLSMTKLMWNLFYNFKLYKHKNPIQRSETFLIQKMIKICQSEHLKGLVREVALNCTALCSHDVIYKPKGTDDAGF